MTFFAFDGNLVSMFATQFGTDYSFEYFMGELKDGRFDANEQVMNYLREDIAA